MYVGSVCTHPSYNDKNTPSVFFLNPYFKIPFSNQAVLRFLSFTPKIWATVDAEDYRYFRFEGNASIPICLNASMFAQIIRDPASSTEEVSIRFFLSANRLS